MFKVKHKDYDFTRDITKDVSMPNNVYLKPPSIRRRVGRNRTTTGRCHAQLRTQVQTRGGGYSRQ